MVSFSAVGESVSASHNAASFIAPDSRWAMGSTGRETRVPFSMRLVSTSVRSLSEHAPSISFHSRHPSTVGASMSMICRVSGLL
ncbi:hypothetical protein BKH13_09095 [Actinomyces naeslundii]|uniref:Uncharacterized protein n=1 Tax=Actinomyces naeslundii TaxID=1655 RepID=A0ABX3EY13_ACTNA|nr:hypothetical protein BKH13_09095 [Actinomyces naeslundii]